MGFCKISYLNTNPEGILVLELFKPKRRSIIGVDISSTSIKVMELSEKSGNYRIEACGIASLPQNSIEANLVKAPSDTSKVFKRLVEQLNLSSKTVALAVPDSAVITKKIQLDEALSEVEIEEMVTIEADKYIPYAIDEINLDFNVLGPSPKNSSMIDVLLVASRAENVSSRVDVVTNAGLEAELVDVESFAIERSCQLLSKQLPAEGKDKTIAIIDVGAHYTHLYILHNLKVIFSREEEFGCELLIKEVSKYYELNHDDARKAMELEDLPASYVDDVLDPFKELVILQVKRTLQFFFSTSNHSYIDYILLAGGATKIRGLTETIQNEVNITTEIANPLAFIDKSSSVDKEMIDSNGPLFLVCCGLAMRNFD